MKVYMGGKKEMEERVKKKMKGKMKEKKVKEKKVKEF